MLNYQDQADGLRRLMAKSSARIISVMTASGQPASSWLSQLAASMTSTGQRTLVIQATQQPATAHTLHAVALRKSLLSRAIIRHPQGYDLAALAENNTLTSTLSGDVKTALDGIVNQLAYGYDTVMIEAILDGRDQHLVLPVMAQHAVVIQMERSDEAIKSAYITIKRLCQQDAQQPLSIMVTGATHAQGQQYFMRLNQVCGQFLGISLNFLGAIPQAVTIQKANGVSHRNGGDTSPAAQLALAFKTIAGSLEKQRLATPSLAAV
ncbi:flagellar biosynthesis protein FlhG [Methylophilus rhizosphaerae]|uniref:Flagellar biosynthesis protein FlhG n=1 Tax=Methylophilus rhizosphaerae TaxID=492660 RepID=A0A1G9ASN7_9PROT|nr:hypothetical protein [Methylophilus rhizosphaerae]SDK30316.1 flagellar biosynthesis protein FlhG [Methylophilus rhizosphaerae]